LTAISAAKAGVPINASAAIVVSSFFITAPEARRKYTMGPAVGLSPFQHSEG